MFLPPYSPQLNPIETYFHHLKTKVKSKTFMIRDHLKNWIEQTIQDEKHSGTSFFNYYRGINFYIEKGLNK